MDDLSRQMNLLAGLKNKEEGMAKATSHAHAEWKDEFRQAVRDLAATYVPFTSEDVLSETGLPSGQIGKDMNNAVGALMNGQARQGVMRKTGRRVLSRRPSSHAAELTEWIG